MDNNYGSLSFTKFIKFNFLPNIAYSGTVGLALVTHLATAQPQTAFGKNDAGTYLLQASNTQAFALDLVAGTTTAQGTGNGNNGILYTTTANGSTLNAAGFNYTDGYIWCQYNGTNQLVRIGTEYVGKAYSFTQPAGYTQTMFTVGDVNATGTMYMTRGGSNEGNTNANTDVYVIDLTQTANPLVASVLSFPNRSYITDWAFSPIDGCLYAINSYFNGSSFDSNNTKIYRFVTSDRTINGTLVPKGTRQTLGVATGGSTAIAPANFAAAFMDANGSFYVVASTTGLAHRIDRPDLLPAVADASASNTTIAATYIGKFNSGVNSNTDGARNAFTRPATGSLPVQLAAFTAAVIPNRRVQLTWTTALEINNAYFEVQHSVDGQAFEPLGRVVGNGTIAQATTYTFTDDKPSAATLHYYRLRQVDQDGTSTYSPVRAVALGSSAVQLAVTPNPASSTDLCVQVQYGGATAAPAILTLRSVLGQVVLAQAVTLQPGHNVLTPNVRLSAGTYWLSLGGEVAGTPGVRVLIGN